MADKLLVSLSAVLLVSLAVTLVIRTVLAEQSAGTGSEAAHAFDRPTLVRSLDIACAALALSAVTLGVLRVVLGTVG
jgi:hypothetical protein